jgi:salicylate hydroxylase
MSFRRWDNGEVIGYTKLVPDFRENFQAPYYVFHRTHFHSALHKRALELGVEVRVNSKVVDYDLEAPSVELENGQVLSADLIVAADGKLIIIHALKWDL